MKSHCRVGGQDVGHNPGSRPGSKSLFQSDGYNTVSFPSAAQRQDPLPSKGNHPLWHFIMDFASNPFLLPCFCSLHRSLMIYSSAISSARELLDSTDPKCYINMLQAHSSLPHCLQQEYQLLSAWRVIVFFTEPPPLLSQGCWLRRVELLLPVQQALSARKNYQ